MARTRQCDVKRIGVYEIRCKENGRVYIGQSGHVYNRICGHKAKLRSGVHVNRELLDDYSKYGESCFAFTVLQVFEASYDAKRAENELIRSHIQNGDCSLLYNKLYPGGERGKYISKTNEDYGGLEDRGNMEQKNDAGVYLRLPQSLLDRVTMLAKRNHRSRNQQIIKWIAENVDEEHR